MTFNEFSAEVRERLRADMQMLRDPAGDVRPSLFIGRRGYVQRERIPESMFASRRTKDSLTAGVAAMVLLRRITLLGWAVTTYQRSLHLPDYTPEQQAQLRHGLGHPDGLMPSEAPDRIEALMLVVFSPDRAGSWIAPISRDGRNPPQYGEWEDEQPDEISGPVFDPIQAAMRRVGR